MIKQMVSLLYIGLLLAANLANSATPPIAVPVSWSEQTITQSPHPDNQSILAVRYVKELVVTPTSATETLIDSVTWFITFPDGVHPATNYYYDVITRIKQYRRNNRYEFVQTNWAMSTYDMRAPSVVHWSTNLNFSREAVTFQPPLLVGVTISTNESRNDMPVITTTRAYSLWSITNNALDSVPYKIQFRCERPDETTFGIDFAINSNTYFQYAFGPELAQQRFPQERYFKRMESLFFEAVRPLNQAEIDQLMIFPIIQLERPPDLNTPQDFVSPLQVPLGQAEQ